MPKSTPHIMQRLLRPLVVGLFVLAFTGAATACLNDVELPRHEREFRSQYRESSDEPPLEPYDPEPPNLAWLTGSGVLLLAGAIAMVVPRGRSAG